MTPSPWSQPRPDLPDDEAILADSIALARQIGTLCEHRLRAVVIGALTRVLIALFADIPIARRGAALDAILDEFRRHILLPDPPRPSRRRRWWRR